VSLRITPSQSAPSPQSPQGVRNSASIGRRQPTTPNHETAGIAAVSSITARSRVSRVSSGSTSRAGSSGPSCRAALEALLRMGGRASQAMTSGFGADMCNTYCLELPVPLTAVASMRAHQPNLEGTLNDVLRERAATCSPLERLVNAESPGRASAGLSGGAVRRGVSNYSQRFASVQRGGALRACSS
jgi:hypothetical protein